VEEEWLLVSTHDPLVAWGYPERDGKHVALRQPPEEHGGSTGR
jgi:hypothetical protein